MDCVSTAYRPVAKVVYNKLFKETKNLPDTEIILSDFIDVKGMKAQGNQVTKLKVKEIVLTHEIEGAEPWPDQQVKSSEVEDGEGDDEMTVEGNTVEWDMKKSEDEDDKDQPKLF
jgi:topoisomerase-4 subunit A